MFGGMPLKQKIGCPKMPEIVNPLTDAQVKNAKPKDKAYKLFDGGELYLESCRPAPSCGA
jgi:hypothetical protein